MSRPFLTIIVPVFNRPERLAPLLSSILGQSFQDFDITMVDDGSDADTRALLNQIERLVDRVAVIHKKNGGAGSARNVGIDTAAGRYLMFVDSDDLLPDGALAAMCDAARDGGHDVVMGRPLNIDNDGRRYRSAVHSRKGLFLERRTICLDECPALFYMLSSCNKIISKQLLIEHGIRYPEDFRLAEDHFFMTQVYARAGSILQLTQNVYLRRVDVVDSVSRTVQINHFRDLLRAITAQRRLLCNELDRPALFKAYCERFWAFELVPLSRRLSELADSEQRSTARSLIKQVVAQLDHSVVSQLTGPVAVTARKLMGKPAWGDIWRALWFSGRQGVVRFGRWVKNVNMRLSLRSPVIGVFKGDSVCRNHLPRLPFVRFGSVKLFQVSKGFQYGVFFASSDPGAAAQVLKWFRTGFLPRERTLVMGRCGHSVRPLLAQSFEKERVSYAFFSTFKEVNVAHMSMILYPYNTNYNAVMIKRLGPVHVWIGHGESDKAASINPMIRIYDILMVSGESAISRLQETRIVNQCDLKSGRVVRIGMPYLGTSRDFDVARQLPRDGAVLYCPTWEGGAGNQQYCSLTHGWGEELIAWLLTCTDHDVVFRPHPSTGQKRAEYGNYVSKIVRRFCGNERFWLHGDLGGVIPTKQMRALVGRRFVQQGPSDSIAQCRMMITDVSSMMSAAVYWGRPFALVVKPEIGVSATRDERLALLSAARLNHGDPLPDGKSWPLFDSTSLEAAHEKVLAARPEVVSVEPELDKVAPQFQLDLIGLKYRFGRV